MIAQHADLKCDAISMWKGVASKHKADHLNRISVLDYPHNYHGIALYLGVHWSQKYQQNTVLYGGLYPPIFLTGKHHIIKA